MSSTAVAQRLRDLAPTDLDDEVLLVGFNGASAQTDISQPQSPFGLLGPDLVLNIVDHASKAADGSYSVPGLSTLAMLSRTCHMMRDASTDVATPFDTSDWTVTPRGAALECDPNLGDQRFERRLPAADQDFKAGMAFRLPHLRWTSAHGCMPTRLVIARQRLAGGGTSTELYIGRIAPERPDVEVCARLDVEHLVRAFSGRSTHSMVTFEDGDPTPVHTTAVRIPCAADDEYYRGSLAERRFDATSVEAKVVRTRTALGFQHSYAFRALCFASPAFGDLTVTIDDVRALGVALGAATAPNVVRMVTAAGGALLEQHELLVYDDEVEPMPICNHLRRSAILQADGEAGALAIEESATKNGRVTRDQPDYAALRAQEAEINAERAALGLPPVLEGDLAHSDSDSESSDPSDDSDDSDYEPYKKPVRKRAKTGTDSSASHAAARRV